MSAVGFVNHSVFEIVIKATLNFYGKYAEPILGNKIISEINTLWNAPQTVIKVNQLDYRINFDIDFRCLNNFEVLRLIYQNTNHEQNYIRIEDKNIAERSMMGYGLGENSGHWLITDQLGESTTAAHEFGHALGLPHPNEIDYRNTGMPPIMAPRGTFVDAEFQWNPLAEVGAFGGTMRPIWRRVRGYEVQEIFKGIALESKEVIPIGVLKNQLFDEIGRSSSIIF